ncbi:MAG: hypothetical protein AAF491_00680 [Verrucomicrobiota bacterium]
MKPSQQAQEEKVSLTTLDGRTFHGVSVRAVDPESIQIFHSGGAARIPLENIPDEHREKWGINKLAPQNPINPWLQADVDLDGFVARPDFFFQIPSSYTPTEIVSGEASEIVILSGEDESSLELEVTRFNHPSLLARHVGDLINAELDEQRLKRFLSTRFSFLGYSQGELNSEYLVTYLISEPFENATLRGYRVQEVTALVKDRAIHSMEPGSLLLLLEDESEQLKSNVRLGELPEYDWLEVRMDSATSDLVSGKQFWKLPGTWNGEIPMSPHEPALVSLAAGISYEPLTPERIAEFEREFPGVRKTFVDREEEFLSPESLPLIGETASADSALEWIQPRDSGWTLRDQGTTSERSFVNGSCLVSTTKREVYSLVVDLVACSFEEDGDPVAFASEFMERHSGSSWESLAIGLEIQAWKSADGDWFCLAISPESQALKRSNLVVTGDATAILDYLESDHFLPEGVESPVVENLNDPSVLHDGIVFTRFVNAVAESANSAFEKEKKDAIAVSKMGGVGAGVKFARQFGRNPTRGEFQVVLQNYRENLVLGLREDEKDETVIRQLIDSYAEGFKDGCRQVIEMAKPAF